jgi:radical SAM protein with 4Fe4S-binding SPASM domain
MRQSVQAVTAASAEPSSSEVSAARVTWEAWREPDPETLRRDGLSTLEALRVINEVRCFGRIPFVLVGLPLRRGDLDALVAHGTRIGLRMWLAPGPDQLTAYHAQLLAAAGLERISLATGGRSWPVLEAEVRLARAAGMAVHATTQVTTGELEFLDSLGRELAAAGVQAWTLAFSGEPAAALRGAQLDSVLSGLAALAAALPLQLEVEGAPQLRRVAHGRPIPPDPLALAPAEGRGLLHVGADGTLQPSAALAVCVGNAREEDLVDAFRASPLLCALRDPTRLGGKCRGCEWVAACGGGSRARAWAATGDLFAPDPACGYEPAGAALPADPGPPQP